MILLYGISFSPSFDSLSVATIIGMSRSLNFRVVIGFSAEDINSKHNIKDIYRQHMKYAIEKGTYW